MRTIDGFDETLEDFDTIEKEDVKEVKKARNRQGYKEKRGLISVSKIKIPNENFLKAIDKAKVSFEKQTGACFGVQNTVLLLLEQSLKDVNSIDDIIVNEYKTGKALENKYIILSFPLKDKIIYDKVSSLAEQQREKYKLNKKAFGVSTMILLLVSKRLIELKYLK